MERREVHFSGQVQGVGFRYTAEAVAAPLAVTGYVQNLPDGRVRLVAEGEAKELATLVEAIEQRMAEYIDNTQTEHLPPTGEFTGFTIRF